MCVLIVLVATATSIILTALGKFVIQIAIAYAIKKKADKN